MVTLHRMKIVVPQSGAGVVKYIIMWIASSSSAEVSANVCFVFSVDKEKLRPVNPKESAEGAEVETRSPFFEDKT